LPVACREDGKTKRNLNAFPAYRQINYAAATEFYACPNLIIAKYFFVTSFCKGGASPVATLGSTFHFYGGCCESVLQADFSIWFAPLIKRVVLMDFKLILLPPF
jgi:hypothetical protein